MTYSLSSSARNSGGISFSITLNTASRIFAGVTIVFISGESAVFQFSFWNLLLCLNPAIYEEMAFRAVFMAFCVWYAEGEMSLFRKFTMYFMMCVPHAAVHGYPLIETLVLSILFGLPFALLQKKRDIASAMISHGIVDAVRFTLTGI